MCNNIRNYKLESVIDIIKSTGYKDFNYDLKETLPDFKVVDMYNDQFIAPILAEVPDCSTTDLENADIILIEAVGATGKTELSRYMSRKLKCPVLDLGKTRVVAGNSLTGLLTKRMQRKDSSVFMDDITDGKATMIIDALDEGYMKTNNQGYFDFLDDVLSLEPNKKCPIVMLGRYNAVELAAAFMLDKGIDFVTLHIEPFTLEQAKQFIDKSVKNASRQKYETVYQETRDYIIETIEGFFKDQTSIKDNVSQRFIGYAPVLQSISAFFDENINYRSVLDDLKKNNHKSVQLIVDIIERILERDRKQKVIPIISESILSNRSADFKKEVLEMIYDNDEQCARILYNIMDKPFPELPIKDTAFLNAYNEHMVEWIREHPFMGKKQPANIVFESYILARMINNVKYRDIAYQYMKRRGTSYMFAYIYYTLYKFDNIDSRTLPYIYESLRELNNKQAYYSFDMKCTSAKPDSDIIECDFEFFGSNENMTSYCGTVDYTADEKLDFGTYLEHIYICAPLDFQLSKMKVEATAPSYVKCRNLVIESEELILHNNNIKNKFVFECDKVDIKQKYNQYLQVSGVGKNSKQLNVICEQKPEYPILDYWESSKFKLKGLSDDMYKRYKKLRSIILEFRSHSKSELGKHHERIDFVLGNTPVGKSVIKALLSRNIMFRDKHLYILNTDIMDKELGLSYDGIRSFEISDEVKKFLIETQQN